jgi:RNA recognition motif-containing protein
MTSIYVGNLPFQCSEEEIRELFEPFGAVNLVKLVSDRETGKPRGFGFVEMNDEDAATAIEQLNGTDFKGRPLRINEARERSTSRPPRQNRRF